MTIKPKKKESLYNKLANFFDRWGDKRKKRLNEMDAFDDLLVDIIDGEDNNPQDLYKFLLHVRRDMHKKKSLYDRLVRLIEWYGDKENKRQDMCLGGEKAIDEELNEFFGEIDNGCRFI